MRPVAAVVTQIDSSKNRIEKKTARRSLSLHKTVCRQVLLNELLLHKMFVDGFSVCLLSLKLQTGLRCEKRKINVIRP